MAMADQFTIDIVRGKDYGTLKFDYGDVHVNTRCWWDPNNKVDAGTYTGAATRMTNKKDGYDGKEREAIYFGQGVWMNGTRKSNDIFIHKGYSAGWSDGCIVADAQAVLSIWQRINPKEVYIVSINVSDEPSDQP